MKKLRYLAGLAAVLLIAAGLPGCGGLAGMLDDMAAPTETGAAPSSAQQRLADRILGEVDGLEARGIRVRFIVAAYSELAAQRVTTAEPEAAPAVLGSIDRLQLMVQAFDGVAYDSVFLETDMRRAALQLVAVLYDSAADAVRGDIIGLADGVDLGNVADRVELRAAQLYVALGLQADIRRSLQELQAGARTAEDLRRAIDARIAANKQRILALG